MLSVKPQRSAPSTVDVMLRVEDLRKRYLDGSETTHAVNGVSFQIPKGTFYTLLGPSGCGKTTTLRCVAGLDRPDSGSITIDDAVVALPARSLHVPSRRRDIGMVFQSYAVWPHLTVYENVAFPLRFGRSRSTKRDVQRRVEEVLAVVRLEGYEGRSATALSGGQQQRLSFARALIAEPGLLLLDEPLASLDAKLRDAMRGEIRALQLRLGITTLFVTHDQTEALSMSDQVAVMSAGKIAQVGTPHEIYDRPANLFVAEFVGQSNLLPGRVNSRISSTEFRVGVDFGEMTANSSVPLRVGEEVTVSARPETIRLALGGDDVENVFSGAIVSSAFMGEATESVVRVGGTSLFVRHDPQAILAPGDEVRLQLQRGRCTVLKGAAKDGTVCRTPDLADR